MRQKRKKQEASILVSTEVGRASSAGKSRPSTASTRDETAPLVEKSRNTNDRYNHGECLQIDIFNIFPNIFANYNAGASSFSQFLEIDLHYYSWIQTFSHILQMYFWAVLENIWARTKFYSFCQTWILESGL